ncbi:MAG: ferritin family protein [Syntrophomonadales bacterium]
MAITKSEFICKLQDYIQDELTDSVYYQELARMAPSRMSQELLMEFSRDEKMHAEWYMKEYCRLTGRKYKPDPVPPPVICNYEQALKQRILEETNAYEEYGKIYQSVCDPCLRRLFWDTRTDEAQHAMRIPILLHEMGIDCDVKVSHYSMIDM